MGLVDPEQVRIRCRIPTTFLSHPHSERVVLLIGTYAMHIWTITRMVPVANAHVSQGMGRDQYAVTRKQIELAERHGKVVGVVHSHLAHHPKVPSKQDYANLPDGWLGGVFANERIVWFCR